MNGIQKYELTHEELEQLLDRAADKAVAKYRHEIEYNQKLRVKDAAKIAKRCRQTIYNWIGDGSLPADAVTPKDYEIKKGDLLKRIGAA